MQTEWTEMEIPTPIRREFRRKVDGVTQRLTSGREGWHWDAEATCSGLPILNIRIGGLIDTREQAQQLTEAATVIVREAAERMSVVRAAVVS